MLRFRPPLPRRRRASCRTTNKGVRVALLGRGPHTQSLSDRGRAAHGLHAWSRANRECPPADLCTHLGSDIYKRCSYLGANAKCEPSDIAQRATSTDADTGRDVGCG